MSVGSSVTRTGFLPIISGNYILLGFLTLFISACNEQPAINSQQQAETALEHAGKHLQEKYICPMHPRIIRGEPANCPLCGMALVKKTIDADEYAHPVVKLSPDVVQKLGVRTAQVERGKLWKFIKTVGYVTYDERRVKTVEVQTAGWVENLGVRRVGLPVTKGQLLFELYSPEFLAVQKDFIAAQKKDQSGTLKKYGRRRESVGPRDYLRYMGVSESLANEIARQGKPRHRLPIYAPQHGTIIRHNIHKHMYLPPGFPMFVIADLSTVWVEADVYEHQLGWVKRNLSAEIEVKALPGRRFEGQLNYIYPELDSRTRTLKVRILVPNPEGILKPNMFAEVSLFGGPKENVLKIPREALIVTGERESVVIAKGNGQYQPVDVVAGMYSQGEVEILSGLKEGDEIVVSGQFLIDSEANLQASFRRMGTAE